MMLLKYSPFNAKKNASLSSLVAMSAFNPRSQTLYVNTKKDDFSTKPLRGALGNMLLTLFSSHFFTFLT